MRDYLQNTLNVPPSNIIALENQQATRANVLLAIRTHLVDNPLISFGDARLFFFAGHGSRSKAPRPWRLSAGENDDEAENGIVETVLTCDESLVDPQTGRRIPGIPGRTLAATLKASAALHGDNLTVVLDCCHTGNRDSSSSSNHTSFIRGVHPAYVSPLPDDVDDDILRSYVGAWHNSMPGPCSAYRSGGFLDGDNEAFVALKACDSGEIACGNQDGGYFTRLLIWALKDPHIRPLSYAEILRAVESKFSQRRRCNAESPPQHPQCRAGNMDRLIFNDHAYPRLFAVRPAGVPGHCLIEGGESTGTRLNTVFDLYDRPTSRSLGRVVDVAYVTEVHSTHSVARLDMGIDLPPTTAAVVAQRPLKFALGSAPHPNARVAEMCKDVRSRLLASTASSDYELVPAQHADVILMVDPQGITIQRRDDRLRRLDTSPPRILPQFIPYALPWVLRRVARFNFLLHRNNPRRPFADDVTVELRRIIDPDGSKEGFSLGARLGKAIPWKNGEAVVPHDQDALYALVLRNYGKTPLYPYVFWMDPATYAVDDFYKPSPWKAAPLRPGKSLELGLYHGSDALAFVVNAGEYTDTGFMRCIFTAEPVEALDLVSQESVLGCDDSGEPFLAKFGPKPGAPDDFVQDRFLHKVAQWDVLTRKITVLGLGQEAID
ncbi:hypothetical protein PUNSTDRAFT_43449 [Punctularia strigosozonata HHB-11173 SS5]|uniref:uncharacterized protein n=1 Tax=Punctularia strigosozonata (strain HHB-11173) TaxID=741275 RepID=UPI00044170FF|nr:uncharacterized protein PUNSTDRAFT_43449 [Punctularia strigosozonata HHB-11173 SS5]EIN10589.1 hypothetical protein PUNSTDRAFT_43449 [Punctularia strigosozonata HHB-11173 SS5]